MLEYQEKTTNVQKLLEANRTEEVKKLLSSFMDPDAADVVCGLHPNYQPQALKLLSPSQTARVMTYLPTDLLESLVHTFDNLQLAKFLNLMAPDDRHHILDVLEAERIAPVLKNLDPDEQRETKALLSYPPDSVGRLMTPKYIRIRPEWNMNQVIQHIREWGEDSESFDSLYVLDEKDRLLNEVSLREVLLSSPDRQVKDIMKNQFKSLNANMDQEEAVRMMERYDHSALPVVNDEGILLGIVTFDDIADVAELETSEDIEKLGGMEALGNRYSSASILKLVRKRVVWLVGLFVGGIFTIFAMSTYQDRLEQYTILALFVPLIIACGGNAGTQTASLMIRALALGDVTLKDWLKVIRRELMSGIMLGLVLGAFGFITAYAVTMVLSPDNLGAASQLMATAIGTSIMSVVICGTLVGSFLPLLFCRFGIDPATSSTPAVTILVDVAGLFLYFFICGLFINF